MEKLKKQFIFSFGFPTDIRYRIEVQLNSNSRKTFPNKGDSIPKGTQTRDRLIKNERVLTTPPQRLLVKTRLIFLL